jgi:hypothetical protein
MRITTIIFLELLPNDCRQTIYTKTLIGRFYSDLYGFGRLASTISMIKGKNIVRDSAASYNQVQFYDLRTRFM